MYGWDCIIEVIGGKSSSSNRTESTENLEQVDPERNVFHQEDTMQSGVREDPSLASVLANVTSTAPLGSH